MTEKTYFTNKIDGTDHLKMNNDGLFIKDIVREKYEMLVERNASPVV